MHHNASQLTNRGPLREGMSTEKARDVMFAYTAPELYEILVTHQHWPINHYADFIYRALVAELLNDEPAQRTIPEPNQR
jgi:hypothetical protein